MVSYKEAREKKLKVNVRVGDMQQYQECTLIKESDGSRRVKDSYYPDGNRLGWHYVDHVDRILEKTGLDSALHFLRDPLILCAEYQIAPISHMSRLGISPENQDLYLVGFNLQYSHEIFFAKNEIAIECPSLTLSLGFKAIDSGKWMEEIKRNRQ